MLLLTTLSGTSFHWIFSESHHGKGEHDGHGANVKCSIKLFILHGTLQFSYFSYRLYFKFFSSDGNTVDNEEEAVDFINKNMRATVAFQMTMTMLDEEEDVTAIPGTNKLYEFRTTEVDGTLMVRDTPCVCKACLDENWQLCENDGWCEAVMHFKGTRNPNAKHLAQQLNNEDVTMIDREDDMEINAILDRRFVNDTIEYLIEWKGFEQTSWVSAVDVEAAELIENWEINNVDIDLVPLLSSNPRHN